MVAAEASVQQFRQVQRRFPLALEMADLLPATEAAGQEVRVLGHGADGREQAIFPDRAAYVIVRFDVTELAGHAAATARDGGGLEAELGQHGQGRPVADQRFLVAMPVNPDGRAVFLAAVEVVPREPIQKLFQGVGVGRDLLGQGLVRDQIRKFVPQRQRAAGLQAHDRHVLGGNGSQRLAHPLRLLAGLAHLPPGNERPSATGQAGIRFHGKAQFRQQRKRGAGDGGLEEPGPGIHEKENSGLLGSGLGASRRGSRRRFPLAQGRQGAAGMHAEAIQDGAAGLGAQQGVGCREKQGTSHFVPGSQPLGHGAHQAVEPRRSVAVEIPLQELRLDARHVDGRRAFALAGLAAEAQIQDVVHVRGPEFFLRDPVRHGVAQGVGPSARGILLLPRGHVAGAHRARIQLAAHARAVAHLDRAGQPVIGAPVELRGPGLGFVVRAEAQIFRGQGRVHDLPRIQQALRVEQAFDVPQGLVQLGREQGLVVVAAGQSVPVLTAHDPVELARQRQAVLAGQAQVFHPARGLQVQQRPHVQASGRGVGVHGGGRHVREQLAVGQDLGHVFRQMLRGHADVFDAGERLVLAALPHEQIQAGLAQFPYLFLLRGIGDDRNRTAPLALPHAVRQAVQFGLDFPFVNAVELGEQHGRRIALREEEALLPARLRPRQIHQLLVQQFGRAGFRVQYVDHGGAGVDDAVEMQYGQSRMPGRRHQAQFDARDHAQRALAADHEAAEIEMVVLAVPHRVRHQGRVQIQLFGLDAARQGGHQPVQGVSAGPAPVPGPMLQDLFRVDMHQGRQALVDFRLQRTGGRQGGHGARLDVAEMGPRGVREPDVGFLHVVHHHPVQDAVAARGIVAHAPAQGGAVGAGGVRADHQAVALELPVHAVQVHARFHDQRTGVRVKLQRPVQVAAEVHDERRAHGLPRQRAPAPAGQDGHAVFVGVLQHALHVAFGLGQHDAERHDLEHARVGAVQHAAVGVEAHVAFDAALEGRGQLLQFGGFGRVGRLGLRRVGGDCLHGTALWQGIVDGVAPKHVCSREGPNA